MKLQNVTITNMFLLSRVLAIKDNFLTQFVMIKVIKTKIKTEKLLLLHVILRL